MAANTGELVGNLPGVPAGLPCSAVAVSPNFQADASVFAGIPGGLLRSGDGGNTWVVTALPLPAPFISALAISPDYETDGLVFAATLEDGVFRTQDRGASWQAWNFGLFDLSALCIAVSPTFAQDRTVYLGTETGLFYSRNGGRAWRETRFPTQFAPVLSLAISPQVAHDGKLFAGTELSGLFYSDNGGQSWQRILDDEAINTLLLSPTFPTPPDLLAVSNEAVWLSQDGGQSWARRTPDGDLTAEFTAAAAPFGLTPESLLLGLADGRSPESIMSHSPIPIRLQNLMGQP